MFASEMEQYIKTGGLADVIRALPQALADKLNIIDVFLPLYREIKQKDLTHHKVLDEYKLKIGSRTYSGRTIQVKANPPNIRINLVENYHLFGKRAELYAKDGKDYRDNLLRFVFFCRASLETIRNRWHDTAYEVFHCHDWQTALIPLYIETSDFFQNKKLNPLRIFTIHNIAYQGVFPKSQFLLLGIDKLYYDPKYLEYWGKINLMKAGLLFSDIITTVSPTYAKEIQTEEYGSGLNQFVKKRSSMLFGILNGVDYQIWNPLTDPYIPANYSISNLKGKELCKLRLQQSFNLTEDLSIPICSVVSRLAWQKGLDLLLKILPRLLLKKKIQFVLLGTGDPNLELQFREFAKQFPSKTGIALTFNEQLAHKITAGADIFLMPSRYEPSGLNDKYSLKYGTVPIVHGTGGLADSIIDYFTNLEKGTGFIFRPFEEKALLEAIRGALEVFNSKSKWKQIQKRGMEKEFSWTIAAKQYLKLYQRQFS